MTETTLVERLTGCMKLTKVSEASGVALDWMVAKANASEIASISTTSSGRQYLTVWYRCPLTNQLEHSIIWEPSTDLLAGGTLIEREMCSLDYDIGLGRWRAFHHSAVDVICEGSTMLIAAMRWYVTSKLGSEVEIPNLLNTPL